MRTSLAAHSPGGAGRGGTCMVKSALQVNGKFTSKTEPPRNQKRAFFSKIRVAELEKCILE
ncbi:hypothetical protein [Hyphomonas adhaerens]|uniref:hypothetical protein n=1 Tax=Hyphomonas adhaerens TaxID=81029 RepID=UPI002353DC52|nr:hypothetical protein [Hyphomonas adhaerens]